MKTIITFLCVLCVFSLFSCAEDDFGSSMPESEIIDQQDDASFQTTNFGESVIADFTGLIRDASGNGVSGAQVKIGGTITETDSNGFFIIQDATTFEHFAFLKVSKDGYISGSRALIPDVNTINDIQVTLLEKNIVATVEAGEFSTAILGESSVSFMGGFIDENNNPYTGSVEVSMHYLKPNERETFEQMPGMLFAQNLSNEARSLETYGMVAINLFSPNGDLLNIAEDSPATIEFPVDNTQIGVAPESIPLWFFDENVGYWKQQGEAVKVGGAYIGEVTHFTWWNCDLPIDYVEVCIILQDENGGLAGAPIQIIRNETGQIIFEGIANQDGNECGLFPAGEEVTLKVFGTDDCADQQIYEIQLGPYNTDTSIAVTVPSETIDQTTLIGTVTNCDGMPLEDGIGLLINSFGQVTGIPFIIENGVLDYTFVYCAETPYEIIIIDQDQNQSTGLLPVSITSEITNLGTLSTCEQQGGVFEGDVILSSQEEVNNFGLLGYSEITGDLGIFHSNSNVITSLLPLNTLEIIGDDLFIATNMLENLEGLENVTSIGGWLRIEYAYSLTTLEHLSGVSSSISSLRLVDNVSLVNLEGLENITIQSGGFITLTGNTSLESAASLENGIPENLGAFSIRPLFIPHGGANLPTPLTDLSFLSNVITVGSIYLHEFQGNSLQGLGNLTSCSDYFNILESPFIENMGGLESLQHVNGYGVIYNSSLISLDGLDNLISITGDNFNVSHNSQLNDFCTLENLFINGEYSASNYSVNNNAYNPTIQDIIDGNCSE